MVGYHLIVKFGEDVLPLTPSVLQELTIIQDMNKFLPEFRMKIVDSTGVLTHVSPFDKNMSSVYIELAEDTESDYKNRFNFAVYNRKPSSPITSIQGTYEIDGLLDVPGLFSPDRIRCLTGNISTNLETIAEDELAISNMEVSTSLAYAKNIVQPRWSNIQLLRYLKENLIGKTSEYGFKCFVKCYLGKTYFVFKSLPEFVTTQAVYKFMLNDVVYEDRLPILSYYIYDYYKIHEIFASKKQSYGYFSYGTSEFISGEEDVQDYESLSDYYLIDENDSEGSNCITNTGRSNDFTSNFAGHVKGSFGNRLMNLVKMWITTNGLPNVVPGNIVQVFFPHGIDTESVYSFQYSGYWMVERVVHSMGSTFLTKLLLTRNGLDTDKSCTLVKSSKRKTV